MSDDGRFRMLPARDRHRTLWRNGGGATWEVAAGSRPDDTDFDWRISIAEVSQAGPFSDYPGVDRIITVIEGAGLDLTVDGNRQELGPRQPFRFRGEASTYGSPMGGTTKDLNVMVRRGRLTAELEMIDLGAGEALDHREPVGTSVLLVLAGQVRGTTGSGRFELLALDGVLAGRRPVELVANGPASVAVVVLHEL
ncbi:MAG TPA: HutD family protein [Candidatus Nanopelagicales bacterium]|jgi:hypothetical protein